MKHLTIFFIIMMITSCKPCKNCKLVNEFHNEKFGIIYDDVSKFDKAYILTAGILVLPENIPSQAITDPVLIKYESDPNNFDFSKVIYLDVDSDDIASCGGKQVGVSGLMYHKDSNLRVYSPLIEENDVEDVVANFKFPSDLKCYPIGTNSTE